MRAALAAALFALPTTLSAQGFGLNEMGACAGSRGYAATGAPCKNATTIFWNPAYAAALTGNSLTLGGSSFDINGSFVRDSALGRYPGAVPTTYLPHLFYTHRQSERLSWGLGVYVPYGLTSQWNNDFPGRFVAQKASLATLYFQPNIAWKLNDKWMVGGGPIIGRSSIELVQGVDLSSQVVALDGFGNPITFGNLGIPAGTEFAQGTVKGSAMAYGATVGIFGQIAEHWTMGARYMSSLNFHYDNLTATFAQIPTGLTLASGNPFGLGGSSLPAGTPVDQVVASQFTAGGALVPQSASTELVHPDQAEIGFAYDGFANWLLSADYAWVGWKRFHELDVHFSNPQLPTQTEVEDYSNSSAIRLGAQYQFHNAWQLRFGFAGVATPVPDESVNPILPDQDRANYTAGLGIPLRRGLDLDIGYTFVWTDGRRGRTAARPSSSLTAQQLNDGVYHLSANVLSLSLNAAF